MVNTGCLQKCYQTTRLVLHNIYIGWHKVPVCPQLLDTFKRVECYVHADGANRVWIWWEFNFRCFLSLKFFLLVNDYQKLFKTIFWKFLPRLFFEFFCFYKFLWPIFLSISQFHEPLTVKFFALKSLLRVGYVVRTPGFHAGDPGTNPRQT